MKRHELIGHEGNVPFLGIWTSHGRVIGFYWCGKRTKAYGGTMFGKWRFGSRSRLDHV